MTRRQLLDALDSQELTGWLSYFAAKAEKDEEARQAAEFEHRITHGR